MAAEEIWDGRDEAAPGTGGGSGGGGRAGLLSARGSRTQLRVAGTVVVVAGLVVAVVHGHHSPPRPERAVAPPVQVIEPEATLPADVELVDVRLEALCLPVTDGRDRLTLSFVLSNAGTRSLPVLDVMPLLPLAGLRPVSRAMTFGDCTTVRPAPSDRLLHPDATLRVTFVFGLPPTCPEALPVQAVVRVRRQDHVVDERVPVFLDLSVVRNFAAC